MTPTFSAAKNKSFAQRVVTLWETAYFQQLDARFDEDAKLQAFVAEKKDLIQAARAGEFSGWQMTDAEIDAIEGILNHKNSEAATAKLRASQQHEAAVKLLDFAKSRSFDARKPFDARIYTLLVSLGIQDARKATGAEGVWESVALDVLLGLVASIPESYEPPVADASGNGAEHVELADAPAQRVAEVPSMVEALNVFELPDGGVLLGRETIIEERTETDESALDNIAEAVVHEMGWSKAPSAKRIVYECLEVARGLVDKNTKYGDSALNPVRIFSKAGPVEQILVRLDDKLSRLKRGDASREDEDVLRDILGYMVLLHIAKRGEKVEASEESAIDRSAFSDPQLAEMQTLLQNRDDGDFLPV
jgi:hypothetical protein